MVHDTTAPRASLERFVPALLAVIVVCLAVSIWRNGGAVAGSADTSGYMNSARLLARGEFSVPIRTVEGVDAATLAGYTDEIYAPLGFRAVLRNGTISPTYPIGLPMMIAAMATVTGWDAAPGLVVGLHALLGVLLVYALGREFGLPPGWSAIGALGLAASPLYFYLSLFTMSDVPAMAWTIATILLARRAARHPAWAVAAGCALGMAVLIRPTNVLALLPVGVALGWRLRSVIWFAVGGLPAAGLLGYYNLHAYGSMLSSGYYVPPGTFALHHAGPTLAHYATWLPKLLTPLVLAALALPWARHTGAREKWILGLWGLTFLGFYAVYAYTRVEWWFLRFVLPGLPALIVGALLVVHYYGGRFFARVSPAILCVVVAAIVATNGLYRIPRQHTRVIGQAENDFRATASWAQRHLPRESVILAMQNSGALFYYTDFRVLTSVWFEPEQFRRAVPKIRAAGRPIYAVLQDFEQAESFAHIPGNWVKVDRVFTRTVWRLEP